MIIHFSPSHGQRCGIASFADYLNNKLEDSKIVSTRCDINPEDVLLIEHEYGLHSQIDWSWIESLIGVRKIFIQHAYCGHPKYLPLNNQLYLHADKVIFLSQRCRIEACGQYSQYADKFEIVPHYAQPLYGEPKPFKVSNKYTIGIHGFAFPRNGFMRLLNTMSGNHSIYMMASISEFNRTAELETSVYLDKIRRRIWSLHKDVADRVRLNFEFYDTKDEIVEQLRSNCDILVHLTSPVPRYYNASGSIMVLLSTGLPVFGMESQFTSDIPNTAMNRISSVADIFDSNKLQVTTTPDGIIGFHEERSVANFAKKIMQIVSLQS